MTRRPDLAGAKLSPAARRFIRSEVRGQAGLVALLFLGGAVYATLEVVGIGLVFPLLAVIMQPALVETSATLRAVMDRVGLTTHRELTMALIVAIAVIMALKNGYMVAFNWWKARASARWKAHISRRLMRIYLMSDFRLHMERAPGVMIRNLSYAAIVFDHYLLSLINIMVFGTVALGIAGLLAIALPAQTLFSVTVLAAGAAGVFVATRRRLAAIGEENQAIDRQRAIVLQQSIGAIRESKILGREAYFLDRFGEIEHHSFERQGHYNFLSSLPGLALETAIILAMLFIVGHVMFLAGGDARGLAVIGLMAAAMFRLLPLAVRIVMNLQLMHLGQPILEIVAGEIDACEPRVRPADGAGEKLDDWRELRLQDVGYTYPDGTRALQGVTLTIRRHEFVGITGPSGSGKTTLMMILLGLIEPTEGHVSVDGRPFTDPATVRRWQNGIGYVPQGLFLVDGSLCDNVAFGSPQPDPDRVARALDAAQLGEYVASQPEGIHAPVGDYGGRLSGGQKQRVVIARALYRDPDVIAFDEATSTLDAVSERAVSDYLRGFKTAKTLLAIAHRLSTIQRCDRIVFLERGSLEGCAPFAELQQQNASFRRLVDLAGVTPA